MRVLERRGRSVGIDEVAADLLGENAHVESPRAADVDTQPRQVDVDQRGAAVDHPPSTIVQYGAPLDEYATATPMWTSEPFSMLARWPGEPNQASVTSAAVR